jgi:acyl-CoA thioester hydrolase
MLENYPIKIEIPIAWGDMDPFNHVNNIFYFKYFESSRIKYFEEIGYFDFIKNGIGPILASTSCKYKFPLVYPDNIISCSRVFKISIDRFWMKYSIFSKKNNKIAAEGEGILVSYDYKNNCKISLPEELKNNILRLENNNVEII